MTIKNVKVTTECHFFKSKVSWII